MKLRILGAICPATAVASVLLSLVTVSAQAKVVVTEEGGRTTHLFEIEGIDEKLFEDWGMQFTTVGLQGVEGYEGTTVAVGAPGIPVARLYVHGNQPVSVLPGSVFVDLDPVENLLYPTQMSMAKSQIGPRPFFMDDGAYKEDAFTPTKAYDVTPAGSVRGLPRQLVTLYPYYYNPVTGEHRYRKSFKVVSKTIKPEPLQNVQRLDETFVFFVADAFKTSPSLREYIALKQRLGYQVYVEYVGETNETPEKIRRRIQDYWRSDKHDLRFVVLVGDIEQLPAKPATHLSQAGFVTDHYYRAIDTDDYQSDINGPDIGVGRISITSETELATVLKKYTLYQLGTYAQTDWLENASFIATDDIDNFSVAEGTHDYVTARYMSTENMFGSFPKRNMLGGDRLYAIRHKAKTQDLVAAFNAGRAIINYSGHGLAASWHGPEFRKENLDQLTHSHALPFVVSNACITGQFTVAESFAETWQRHPKGGVFFWGSMDNTFWNEDDILEKEMYRTVVEEGQFGFSQMTQAALAKVWQFYGGDGYSKYYWETYHSFGDPSLMLRNRKHQWVRLAVGNVKQGARRINARVIDRKGAGVAGVRVVLTEPHGRKSVVVSGTSGHVTFGVPPWQMRVGNVLALRIAGPNIRESSFTTRVGW